MEPDPIEIVTLKAKIAVDAGFANEMAQFCNSTVPVGATSGTIDLSCDAGVAAANNVGAALLSAGGSTLTMADVKEVQITYETDDTEWTEWTDPESYIGLEFNVNETMNVTVIDEAMTSLSALTPLDITVPGKNGTFIDAEVPGQEIVVTFETTSTPSCYNTNGDTVPKTPFTNANISALAEFLVNTSNAVRCADTSQMTSFENLFSGQTPRALDRSLAGLDTSTITNMDGAFENQRAFVGLGVETWNMSSVTSARGMFGGALSFNGDVTGWGMNNVNNTRHMFAYAHAFTGTGVETWNLSEVTDATCMFCGVDPIYNGLPPLTASNSMAFNGNVTGWGLEKLQTARHMFVYATEFVGNGVETWDLSELMDAHRMFLGALVFNGNVAGWGLEKLQIAQEMFFYAPGFVGIGVKTWDLSGVTNAAGMFVYAGAFNGNVTGWNMSRVETAKSMFTGASNFRGTGTETWAMPALVNAETMFAAATSFNGDVTGWGMNNVNNTKGMFARAIAFIGRGIETWTLSEVTDATCMFCGVDSQSMAFNGHVTGWGLAKLQIAQEMFSHASEFVGIGVETWNMPALVNAERMFFGASSFNGNVTGWGMSRVETAERMFDSAYNFTGTGVETWTMPALVNAENMFMSAASFNGNVTGWGMNNVNNTNGMFYSASSFIGHGAETWDLSEVKDTGYMFMYARGFDGNVAGWNMSRVKNAERMFAEAWNFTGTGVETWAMPALVNAEKMFYLATSFNGDVTGWGMNNVDSTKAMFAYASAFTGIGIDTWNVNNVTNANGMFYDAVLFNGDLEQWCMDPAVTSTTNMFDGVAPEATPCWYSGALPCCGAAAPTPRPTAAVTPPPTGSPTGGVEAPSGGGGGDDHTAAYVGGGVAVLVAFSAAGYVYTTYGKTDGIVLKM